MSTEYDLQFSEAGKDSWVSRNNSYQVFRVEARKFIVLNGRGIDIAETTFATKARAFKWANEHAARDYDMSHDICFVKHGNIYDDDMDYGIINRIVGQG